MQTVRDGVKALASLPFIALAACLMAIPARGAQTRCAAARNRFSDSCAMCHNSNGKGYPAIKTPDFTDPHWQATHKDAALREAISNGVKGTAMPAFKGQLKPAEIDALVKCVIRGFAKKVSAKSERNSAPSKEKSKH